MKPVQTIRIALALVVIFAAGAVTGRLTAPRPRALVPTADGRFTTSDTAFERLKRHLELSAEQERQFRRLLEEMARQMSKLPPASQERMDVFHRNVPRMEALLKPEQREDFKRYVRESEARWERSTKRRSEKGR
jgi:hypothetical protein